MLIFILILPLMLQEIYFICLGKFKKKNELGQNMFQNLPYSQFVRIDNQFIASRNLKRTQSLHLKFSIGGGKPFGNSTTSMPYDYSFFGGGSNDNRGWRSRALGPGGYKYHLDSNSLITQVADIRIGGSFEYRFPITSSLKGAFLVILEIFGPTKKIQELVENLLGTLF